jgi:GT2 family glycosyltransferase
MIAVVILSYHHPDDLRRCITSVLRTDYPKEQWRCIVVDNASRPDTRECITSFGDRVVLLSQEENLGYAEGMNVGIRYAIAEGATYVVLLNQDTEVEASWLTPLVQAMETDSSTGAAQSRVMLGGTADLVNSVGNEIHVLGFGFAGGHRTPWTTTRAKLSGYPYPVVTYCSGAAVMLRVAALRDVAFSECEYFDAAYFMYHEDLDLGVRLWMRGWQSVVVPQSVVWHFYDFNRSMQKLFFMERNRLVFLYQNFRLGTFALLAPMIIFSECGLLILARRNGWAGEKVRAWRALIRPANWSMWRKGRRARQRARQYSDRVMLARFTPRLSSPEVESPFVTRIVNPMMTAWWRIVYPLIRW